MVEAELHIWCAYVWGGVGVGLLFGVARDREADIMMDQINALRFQDFKHHVRIESVERALRQLNFGQGNVKRNSSDSPPLCTPVCTPSAHTRRAALGQCVPRTAL